MKECKTGGRLIKLLASKGYVVVGKNGLTVLWLSKLYRDRITANEFLTWRSGHIKAIDTDLVDLNEKLLEHNFEPLRFKVNSMAAEKTGNYLIDNFGRKVEIK